MARRVLWKMNYPPPDDLVGAVGYMNAAGEFLVDSGVLTRDDVGGGGGILTVTVPLTATQIAALNAVPIEIVPAQGLGLVIVPISACFEYKAGTQPFGANNAVQLTLGGFTVLAFGDPLFAGIVNTVVFGSLNISGIALADAQNAPLMLSAGDLIGGTGAILTMGVTAGGSSYKIGDVGTIGPPGSGATYTVATVSNGFVITAVNTGAKTFTVVGDRSGNFSPADTLTVYGLTANDGDYEVVSAVFGAGVTVITVVEVIASSVVDGALGNAGLDIGVVATLTLTAAGTGYPVTSDFPTVATTGVGTGLVVEVLTATNLADGTGRIFVIYAVMPAAI